LAMAYPVSVNTSSQFSPFVTIMYDYRFDMKNFFVEWAAGARVPAQPFDESIRSYGGVNLEIGGSYYLTNNTVGAYIGGGINPFFDILFNIAESGIGLGIAPFVKFGIMFPQTSKVRTYFDLKVAQNVIPITTGSDYYDDYYDYYSTTSTSTKYVPKRKNYPTEIGLEVGIAW
ncbi:MAG TPA: hypothetical protein VHO70_18340, partial [Chitinispirillaceae bacterium]|nr:hypothetical protein [Chitinispirillaceae bacterium]